MGMGMAWAWLGLAWGFAWLGAWLGLAWLGDDDKRDAEKEQVKGLTEVMDFMVMVINLWIPYKVVNLHNQLQ